MELRRKPQLAPLLLPLLALVAAGVAVLAVSLWTRTTVVILVRHAEAASSPTSDPDLSPAGESRARQLGEFLADALPAGGVDHLYAADTRRSQQTGRIEREHRGATVVVVGYAASLEALARRLAGAVITLDEGDFGSILVVVKPSMGEPQVLRLRYGEVAAPARSKT